MSDRESRADRLGKRLEDEPQSKTDKKSQTEQTGKTSENDKPSVKDRPSTLMYLPGDVDGELDVRFDELNAKHKRKHGEPLEKNRDYYPAVIKAGLEGKDVEELLNL